MSEQNDSRISVDLQDFIEVVLDRDTYPTKEKAAEALGYTNVVSFTARLARERKKFPEFSEVPEYPDARTATKEDVSAIFARIRAANAAHAEAEAGEAVTTVEGDQAQASE